MKYEYGVFLGHDRNCQWARFTNKRFALGVAKRQQGEVRRKLYSRDSWDAPTFRVCSEQIADFRTVKSNPNVMPLCVNHQEIIAQGLEVSK